MKTLEKEAMVRLHLQLGARWHGWQLQRLPRAFGVGITGVLGSFAFAFSGSGQVLASFDPYPDGSRIVGLGYGSNEVYVYPDFGTQIDVFDRAGNALRSIPSPGGTSNDYDLEVLEVPAVFGNVTLPTGTLLVINGDTSPTTVFGLDPADGTVLASVPFAGGPSTVGGAYNPADGLLYSLNWRSDEVAAFDPADGSLVRSFSTTPPDQTVLDVFFGDLDIDGNGNLRIVTDVIEQTRVLTTTGDFVEDFSLDFLLPNATFNLAGIAFDNARGEAWLGGRAGDGLVYRVTGFPRAEPDLAGDFNGNGAVEQSDLDLVLGNWGSGRGNDWANTEPLVSFVVDQEDLDAVLANWGASTPGASGSSSVPEPVAALGLSGLLLAMRRRL